MALEYRPARIIMNTYAVGVTTLSHCFLNYWMSYLSIENDFIEPVLIRYPHWKVLDYTIVQHVYIRKSVNPYIDNLHEPIELIILPEPFLSASSFKLRLFIFGFGEQRQRDLTSVQHKASSRAAPKYPTLIFHFYENTYNLVDMKKERITPLLFERISWRILVYSANFMFSMSISDQI